jgi:hypothetical protein
MFDDTTAPPRPTESRPSQLPSGPELPLERLESEICTLAGHLAAATCRWLTLIAEFDRREGWRTWDQASCAAWLSWKCGVSLTTAHEHVRVSRSLAGLPGIAERFGAGRLSYAKVRALTRVASAENEQDWLVAADHATAAQLDRLVSACRTADRAESADRVAQEKLTWRYQDDGMLVMVLRLAPERGQRVLSAIEQFQHAAAERERESSAEDSRADERPVKPGCGPLEAFLRLIDVAREYGDKPVDAGDIHQVVVQVDERGDRCHLHDGPAIHPETLRRMTCEGATRVRFRRDRDGTPLDAGRTTRKVPAALRRAVLDRARGRCQFPGCARKAWLQIHHVKHWLDHGRTDYANLCVLCSHHHTRHHLGGYEVIHDKAAPGHFRFRLPDGTPVEHAPTPPHGSGDIGDQHEANVGPTTIQPTWYGDPLHLDYATSVMRQRASGCDGRCGGRCAAPDRGPAAGGDDSGNGGGGGDTGGG